jgi:phosphopantetheinyl transferase
MPLYKQIQLEECEIVIWNSNESLNQLQNSIDLPESEQLIFDSFSNDKRKREFLISRIIIKNYFGEYQIIKYNKNRAPYLLNGVNINISHSNNFQVLIFSKNHRVSIDIEEYSERIFRVVNKAFSEQEQSYLKAKDIKEHVKFWCAKEALIKIQDNRGIDFRNKLNLYYENKQFKACMVLEATTKYMDLNSIIEEDFAIVYCVDL